MLHVADGVTGCVRLVWFARGLDSQLNKQACMVLVTWSAAAASHTLAKCERLPGWKNTLAERWAKRERDKTAVVACEHCCGCALRLSLIVGSTVPVPMCLPECGTLLVPQRHR